MPPSTGANAKVGIISLGGGWLASDFNSSMANLGLSATSANVTTVLVDGASGTFSTNDSNASAENTLDLYCVGGIVPSANIVIYIGQNGPVPGTGTSYFANVLNRAVNENCDVITISWGVDEYYNGGDFLAAPLANAAAKGITVLAASGDYGSESGGTPGVFSVNYPASSPNVVAVGGTTLTYNTSTYARISEITSNSSGGGMSTIFSVPIWQSGLKANLFFSSNSHSQLTSLTGRGVPDISAPYSTYVLWYNGNIVGGSGTSASTPIMAGMIARFISLNGGKRPPIGTITNSVNPILYSNTSSYYDITVGNDLNPLTSGFSSNIGWDAVTGLGAPIGNVLYNQFTSGGTKVKSTDGSWHYVANVRVKTAPTTWSNVRAIWTKTINGWNQTY
jgi:kumamolisin